MNYRRVKIPSYFFPPGGSLANTEGRPGENVSLCFSVFEASLVVRGLAISKNLKRFLLGDTRENKVSQVKKVRTTPFSFVFSKFFSLWREQFL